MILDGFPQPIHMPATLHGVVFNILGGEREPGRALEWQKLHAAFAAELRFPAHLTHYTKVPAQKSRNSSAGAWDSLPLLEPIGKRRN
jgi:hypothetical protein